MRSAFPRLRPSSEVFMLFELYVGGAMAAGLAVYLIFALIHPEDF